MLKKVMVIRHGHYDDESERLNNLGRRQMQKIASEFIPLCGMDKTNTLILSSSAPRAADSAEVLNLETEIPFKVFPELWSDNRHRQNNTRAIELIKTECEAANVDSVIIVTHMEYAESLPDDIVTDAGKNFEAPYITSKGCAGFFNLETGETKRLSTQS